MVTTTNRQCTAKTDTHGAEMAVDALMFLHRYEWEQAIRRAAADNLTFSADDLQAAYGLPSVGNATGGLFLKLHAEGVIKRIGYRASRKRSRAGGVVAVWSAGDAA